MARKESKKQKNRMQTERVTQQERARREGRLFAVHKYDGEPNRYDLHIDIDGVLKSWMLPDGPSLDPRDKQRALYIEERSVSFADFEGIIPDEQGEEREVVVWDAGWFEPALAAEFSGDDALRRAFEEGRLGFRLHGRKLRGRFSLVRTDEGRDHWVLIKSYDRHATRADVTARVRSVLSGRVLTGDKESSEEAAFPDDIAPMFSVEGDLPFDDGNWIFEYLWEGERAIAEVRSSDDVRLLDKDGETLNKAFPSVVAALRELPHRIVLDGQIIGLSPEGVVDTDALDASPTERAKKDITIQYVVFDVLYHNGEDLRNLPLEQRREIVERLLPQSDVLAFSVGVRGEGTAFFEGALEEGVDGIIAKHAKSPYLSGKQSEEWKKIRAALHQKVVVAGYTRENGGALGSLVLGVYDQEQVFRYIGQVSEGFEKKQKEELAAKLRRYHRKTSPFAQKLSIEGEVQWVTPRLVCEVRHDGWVTDTLRDPMFAGLREDVHPQQARHDFVQHVSATEEDERTDMFSGIDFTHLHSFIWEQKQITKEDLLNYYAEVADMMMPYLLGRPHVLHRHPNGALNAGFYQKNAAFTFPARVDSIELHEAGPGASVRYLVCRHPAALMYMVELGCIEILPWLSTIDTLDRPTHMIFEIGTEEDADWGAVVRVAEVLNKILSELPVPLFYKTTGNGGLHAVVPLGARYGYRTITEFSRLVVGQVIAASEEAVGERAQAKSEGKLFLDYLSNQYARPWVAPYSVRPNEHASISLPVFWQDIEDGLDWRDITLSSAGEYIHSDDPWNTFFEVVADLHKAIERLRE